MQINRTKDKVSKHVRGAVRSRLVFTDRRGTGNIAAVGTTLRGCQAAGTP
jgi:hypothetical protein